VGSLSTRHAEGIQGGVILGAGAAALHLEGLGSRRYGTLLRRSLRPRPLRDRFGRSALCAVEDLPLPRTRERRIVRRSRNSQETRMSDTVLSRDRFSVYAAVTNHIVEAIEAGAERCVCPIQSLPHRRARSTGLFRPQSSSCRIAHHFPTRRALPNVVSPKRAN
jgi:hypothetical protein